MVGGITFALIKLGRCIRRKLTTLIERRREQVEVDPVELRQMQENLHAQSSQV